MRLEGDTGRSRAFRTLALGRRSTLTQPNARSLPSKIITRTNAYVRVLACQARRDTAYPLLLEHSQTPTNAGRLWKSVLLQRICAVDLSSSPGSATLSQAREAPCPIWVGREHRVGTIPFTLSSSYMETYKPNRHAGSPPRHHTQSTLYTVLTKAPARTGAV